MMKRKRIAIATGTRADWGLLKPLADELRGSGAEVSVLATFMHLFGEQGYTFQEIISDGYEPYLIPAPRDPAEATAEATKGFAARLREEKPDVVVILGDRFEMLGAATGALLARVPVAHIAGGTTSAGAIDDYIRKAISQLSSFHFPETPLCARRLKEIGIPEQEITVAGALGVWNTMNVPLMAKEQLEESIGFRLGERFLLGTLHPATLSAIPPEVQMQTWLEAISDTMESEPTLKVLLTYPNSDTDTAPLIELLHKFERQRPQRVKIVNSLGRIRYLSAAKLASSVIGNSSSGIVEVPSLGTVVVDCGNRQSGRERSEAVIHADLSRREMAEAFRYALTPEAQDKALHTPNPYYLSGTPAIIASTLLSNLTPNP